MTKTPLESCGVSALICAVALGLSMFLPVRDTRAETSKAFSAVADVAISEGRSGALQLQLPAGRHVIARAPDGLFYVDARANGRSIRFVIDTGATVVVLKRSDAEKLGIDYSKLAGAAQIKTVAGPSAMRWATIEQLDTAGHQLKDVKVAVVDHALPVSLMGQNALSQFGSVTMRGDTIMIEG